jgi:hypothetical protein
MDTSITLINNDGYGAPELKKVHPGLTLKGFIIAIILHVIVIISYFLISYISGVNHKNIPVNPNSPSVFAESKRL